MTLRYVDVNLCEDDAFNVYLKWKDETGTDQQRFIALLDMVSSPPGCCGTDPSGNPCPETTKEIPLTVALDEVGSCCQIELALVFDHANCCNTYAVFTLVGPGGEVTSSSFDQSGLDETFDIRDICNPAP